MAKAAKLAKLPDVRNITIGCYTLTSTGLDIKGEPTYDEHEDVGQFIQRAHQASGWWLADWLRYGESRADWRDRLDQAIDTTGLSHKTLQNVRAIGAIDKSRRRDAVEFTLHGEVAGMPADQQVYWLARAEAENWTRADLRDAIRAKSREPVLDGRAETVHTVDVTVQVHVEAASYGLAEQKAWALVKDTVKPIRGKVIAAYARQQ